MQDEIARIKTVKPVDELKEYMEADVDELQKLADADSEGEEPVDDWKEEVRKLSNDAQGESDPELSDADEVITSKLTQDQVADIKTAVLRSSLQNILLSVTNDFIGKICRNALSRASSDTGTSAKQSAGLGGLIGYGSDSDDSDADASDDGGDSDWSVDSETIRKKRKIFDRDQRKRIKQILGTDRGPEDDSSTEGDSKNSSRYSSPARRRRSRSHSRSKRSKKDKKRSRSRSKSSRRDRHSRSRDHERRSRRR